MPLIFMILHPKWEPCTTASTCGSATAFGASRTSTHAHLDAVLGWARELNVGQLLLTHLDKSMDYATLVAELPDWAAPARDGQEIVL